MANKKMTLNALIETLPEIEKAEVKLEGGYFKDVTLQVKRMLPLGDAVNFVNDIATMCLDEERGEYQPEYFDFMVRLCVVMYYANVDLTKDIRRAYRVLYETNLFELVYQQVNNMQASNLILAAEKRVEHARHILESSVAGKVTEMMNKMENIIAGSEQMMEVIDDDGFKEAVKNLANVGVLKLDENVINQFAEQPSQDGIAEAEELMAGLAEQDKEEKMDNVIPLTDVISMKKKK